MNSEMGEQDGRSMVRLGRLLWIWEKINNKILRPIGCFFSLGEKTVFGGQDGCREKGNGTWKFCLGFPRN